MSDARNANWISTYFLYDATMIWFDFKLKYLHSLKLRLHFQLVLVDLTLTTVGKNRKLISALLSEPKKKEFFRTLCVFRLAYWKMISKLRGNNQQVYKIVLDYLCCITVLVDLISSSFERIFVIAAFVKSIYFWLLTSFLFFIISSSRYSFLFSKFRPFFSLFMSSVFHD